jgi:hypothetical protein
MLEVIVSNYNEFKKFLSQGERVIFWVDGKQSSHIFHVLGDT